MQGVQKQRILEKTERLSLPIPKVRSRVYEEEYRTYDIKTESIKFPKLLDVARERGYKLQELLSHELVAVPINLFKDGFMRDRTKSDLEIGIKKMYNESPLDMIPYNEMLVIDFMAYARKIKVKDLSTRCLLNIFESLRGRSIRIDIIFDVYCPRSIKYSQRVHRAGTNVVQFSISSENQKLPADIKSVWICSENKLRWQQFFLEYSLCHYQGNTVFFFGSVVSQGHVLIRLIQSSFLEV